MEDAYNIKRLSDIDKLSSNSDPNGNFEGSRNTIDEILLPIKDNLNLNESFNEIKKVKCLTHGNDDVIVDPITFKLKCNTCALKGLSGYDLELSESNHNLLDSRVSFCDNHKEDEANFFCNTCKIFICSTCISSDHRHHNSNLIKTVSDEFRRELKNIPYLLDNQQIEENYEKMKNYSNTLKDIKAKFKLRLNTLKDNISSVNDKQIIQLQRDFQRSLNQLDVEAENFETRLLAKLNMVNMILGEIEDKGKVLEGITDPYKLCEYKQTNYKGLLETKKKLEEECEYLLRIKNKEIVSKTNTKKKDILEMVERISKRVKVYEKTVIACIQSGTTSNSFLVRRFKRFMHDGIKYFKTTSLNLKMYESTFLVGLGLCGLYSKKKKEEAHASYKPDNPKLKINIQIIDENNNINLNEVHHLSEVVSKNDPTILIHFNVGVVINPLINYTITVTNMDESHYIDIWNGGVSEKSFSSMNQEVLCNNTLKTFVFSEAKNIQIDFNEFNCGIIEGLIYSNI